MTGRHRMGRVSLAARYLWASPATLVGLALSGVALACGAAARTERGVLEVFGGGLAKLLGRLPVTRHFEAVTLGHVVLADSRVALDRQRRHERAHVRQFERWGVLLFPMYIAAGIAEAFRGRHPYRDNRFERQARAAETLAD